MKIFEFESTAPKQESFTVSREELVRVTSEYAVMIREYQIAHPELSEDEAHDSFSEEYTKAFLAWRKSLTPEEKAERDTAMLDRSAVDG